MNYDAIKKLQQQIAEKKTEIAALESRIVLYESEIQDDLFRKSTIKKGTIFTIQDSPDLWPMKFPFDDDGNCVMKVSGIEVSHLHLDNPLIIIRADIVNDRDWWEDGDSYGFSPEDVSQYLEGE